MSPLASNSLRDFQGTPIPSTTLASKALWSGLYHGISLITGLHVKYTLVNSFDLRYQSDIYNYKVHICEYEPVTTVLDY